MRFALIAGAGSLAFLAALVLLWTTPRGEAVAFAYGSLPELVTRLSPLSAWSAGLLLLVAFLIKVPALGLHVWLPHAHVEAPTPVSVILAGVLLKLGVYGLVILWPAWGGLFAPILPALAWLGAAGVVGGALLALGQQDLKRIVAYSSVSHLGWCILGLASGQSAGVQGAQFIALAHGLASPLLFLLVGMLYERAHHRRVDGFGGLAAPMPAYAWCSAVAWLTAAGLPGLAGFPGEFLVVIGGMGNGGSVTVLATGVACLGVLLGAAYALWTLQRLCYGPLRHAEQAQFPDLDRGERLLIGACLAGVLLLGLWPTGLLSLLEPLSQSIAQAAGGRP